MAFQMGDPAPPASPRSNKAEDDGDGGADREAMVHSNRGRVPAWVQMVLMVKQGGGRGCKEVDEGRWCKMGHSRSRWAMVGRWWPYLPLPGLLTIP